MKGGLGDLMKQAQQMQEQLRKVQEEIAASTVTGEAGAGLVRVVMNGRHDVERVHIDPSLLDEGDAGMLEDLMAAAINDASRKVEEMTRSRLAEATSGLGLPPGLNLPL